MDLWCWLLIYICYSAPVTSPGEQLLELMGWEVMAIGRAGPHEWERDSRVLVLKRGLWQEAVRGAWHGVGIYCGWGSASMSV